MTEKLMGRAVATFVLMAGGLVVAAPAFATNNSSDSPKKITFCHNGHSITTAVEAFYNPGHQNHEDDIVPPFSYEKRGQTIDFPGLNWDEVGQAAFADGCATPVDPDGGDTDAGVDVGAGTDSGTDAGVDVGAGTGSGADVIPDSDIDAGADADAGTDTDSGTDPGADVGAGAEPVDPGTAVEATQSDIEGNVVPENPAGEIDQPTDTVKDAEPATAALPDTGGAQAVLLLAGLALLGGGALLLKRRTA